MKEESGFLITKSPLRTPRALRDKFFYVLRELILSIEFAPKSFLILSVKLTDSGASIMGGKGGGKYMRQAWSRNPPLEWLAPYFLSPKSGCPRLAAWALIWWVLPVSILKRTSEQISLVIKELILVTAYFPFNCSGLFPT